MGVFREYMTLFIEHTVIKNLKLCIECSVLSHPHEVRGLTASWTTIVHDAVWARLS